MFNRKTLRSKHGKSFYPNCFWYFRIKQSNFKTRSTFCLIQHLLPFLKRQCFCLLLLFEDNLGLKKNLTIMHTCLIISKQRPLNMSQLFVLSHCIPLSVNRRLFFLAGFWLELIKANSLLNTVQIQARVVQVMDGEENNHHGKIYVMGNHTLIYHCNMFYMKK